MPDHYSLTFLIRRGDAARRPPPPPLRHSGLPFSPRRAAHTNPHVPVEAYRGAAVSGSLLMLIERLLVTPPRATSGRAGSPCGAKFRAPSPCRTKTGDRKIRFMHSGEFAGHMARAQALGPDWEAGYQGSAPEAARTEERQAAARDRGCRAYIEACGQQRSA
jgi:hypothetical protein